MSFEGPDRRAADRGRRASDLTARQQTKIAQALTTFSEATEEPFEETSALEQLIEACRTLNSAFEFGVVVRDKGQGLRVIAASSEAVKLIDERQLEDGDGPVISALDLATGMLEVNDEDADGRWPRYGPFMRSIGFKSVCVVPLRTKLEVVGALNVYCRERHTFLESRMEWFSTLAAGAASAIGNSRSSAELLTLTQQLQTALDSRIIIEQSKGIIAAKLGVDISEAFELLRGYSRSEGRSIHKVAEDIISNRISVFDLKKPKKARTRPSA
jgi:GAF domain-containing protein